MTEGYYIVALIFPDTLTLRGVYEALDRLSDNGIDVDYATLEFTADGLYCDARTRIEDIEETVKCVGNGDVFLDWDTMSDWEV